MPTHARLGEEEPFPHAEQQFFPFAMPHAVLSGNQYIGTHPFLTISFTMDLTVHSEAVYVCRSRPGAASSADISARFFFASKRKKERRNNRDKWAVMGMEPEHRHMHTLLWLYSSRRWLERSRRGLHMRDTSLPSS